MLMLSESSQFLDVCNQLCSIFIHSTFRNTVGGHMTGRAKKSPSRGNKGGRFYNVISYANQRGTHPEVGFNNSKDSDQQNKHCVDSSSRSLPSY